MKNTKRSLLFSVLALILCCALLAGTTLAWFTDTASTAVNKIQAGTLDVALEMKNAEGTWVTAEGETLSFKKAAGAPADEQVLWEPGCTYQLPELRIVNKGNLNLKYKIAISGIVGSEKLLEAIDFTVTGVTDAETATALDGFEGTLEPTKETGLITITGHMKETAGNEYQGLSIDGIGITVYAAQATGEYDSFNEIYDTNATYLNTDAEGNFLISSADELVFFAKDVNVNGNTYVGKTVKLTADINLADKKWIPVGQTQVSSFQGTFDGQNHTIKNMTVNYTGTNTNYACGLFGWIELHNGSPIVIQNVRFDKANVTGIKYTGVVAGYAGGASGAKIKNCVVTNSTVVSNTKNAGGIIGYMGKGVLTGNTVSGCTISAKLDVGGIANSVEPAVTFQNNKVENTTIYYEETQAYDAAGIFTGGKVVYRDDNTKTTFVPDGTNTSSDVTVSKQVTVSNAEQLSAALNATYNANTVIKLANDITLSGEWGVHELNGSNNAKLTINGNGKTISGLTATEYYDKGGFDSNGLVTTIGAGFSSVTFKNLTVSGAKLTNNGGEDAATGVFVGNTNTVNVAFENCTVTGATVNCDQWAGGFVGYAQDVATSKKAVTFTNCVVSDSEIKTAGSSVGGLVGHSYTDLSIRDCQITGKTSIACTEDRKGKVAKAGYLIGTVNGGSASINNITVESNVGLDTRKGTTYDTTNYVGRNYATVNGVTANS